MQWASELLDGDILLAKNWLFTRDSVSSSELEPKHWILEAHNMHKLSLAVLQHRIHEHASPTSFQIRPGINSLSMIETPSDPEVRNICRRQKTRSSEHYSVSVLGMSVILVVGSLLICLDWFLIQPIFWFGAITHKRSAKKDDWTSAGTLQLQKQVLESRGVGNWMTTTRDLAFPVLVEKGRVFRHLGARGESWKMARLDGRSGSIVGGAAKGQNAPGSGYTVLEENSGDPK